MADNQNFYDAHGYGDNLDPGKKLKLEHYVSVPNEKADISKLTAIPLERLAMMKIDSAAAEQTIFQKLQGAVSEWEAQAAQTALLDKAIEYAKTPAVQHTSNKWGKSSVNSDFQTMSNAVYSMSYHVYERTKYERETQKSIPVAWELSWSIVTNNPRSPNDSYYQRQKIAGQDRKVFTSKPDMEKYLAGRIKAYSNLFTEISPPIPQEYVKSFTVNGQLLPGYTVQGEEPKQPEQPDRAADVSVGGDSISEPNQNEQRKERTDMTEPLNILLVTHENDAGGAWLKLPATAEQLQAALAGIGAQGGEQGKDYFIKNFQSPVSTVAALDTETVQRADIDTLNFLAAALQSRDDRQIEKLNAANEMMTQSGTEDIHRLAELTQNTDVYDFHPDIFSNVQLGEHTLEHSGLIQIPDEWEAAIDVEMLGQLAAASEKGMFTEYGYIVPNGEEWKPITEIPQEYQITPKIGRDYEAVATTKPERTQTKPAAVIPLVLTSENPRDKLKEITGKLEQGIKNIFDSDRYKDYLKTLSKFHNYSMNNCILIAMQKPDASHVAGFNAWRDNFKRPVMKGEKGIKILAPAPFKTTKEVDRVDGNGQPVYGKDGKRVKDEVEITVPAFKVTTVFDVSQTDGEPLPHIGVAELTGSVDKYKEFFAALEKTSLVPIGFEAIKTGAKGYYDQMEKRIAINEDMSELQNLKTAIHEIAHSRLHAIDTELPLKGQDIPDRRTREVEAESIAFTVCAHYGLDTSDYSFGYVATWSGEKQLDALKSSLDTIRKEADAIIKEVDAQLADLQQDKTQTAEHTAVQGLEQEVEKTMQFFVDEDIKNHGAVQPGTLETLAVQGYEYRDGKLQQAAPPNNTVPERQPGFEKWSEPATPENAPDNPGVPSDNVNAYLPQQPEPGDTFTIYQLKPGDETRDLRFEPLSRLEAAGLAVALANYELIYTAPLEAGATLDKIYQTFNIDRPEDFTGHSLSVSDVVVMNRDGKETAFYVNDKGFQELPGFLPGKDQAREAAAPTVAGAAAPSVNLVAVAGYMQKLNDGLQAVKPDSPMSVTAFNATVKRLEQSNERIPADQPQLKALITHAAQSPDFNTLKERINTIQSEFTQHYSTAVQNTVDMSGKAQPSAPGVSMQQREHSPAPKAPTYGENVAAIEAQVIAGKTISISDLAVAINADKQAAQKALPGTQHTTGKGAATHAAPGIRDELAAAKKQLTAQKSAPAKTAAKNKNAGLED